MVYKWYLVQALPAVQLHNRYTIYLFNHYSCIYIHQDN